MKEFLQKLRIENKKHFDLFVYLWLWSSEKGKMKFNISKVSLNYGISRTSLLRVINSRKDLDIQVQGNGNYTIDFKEKIVELQVIESVQETAVSKIVNKDEELHKRMKLFLVDFYEKQDFFYPDFNKQFRFAPMIMKKLDVLMKARGLGNSDDERLDSFKTFFERLPEFWINNKVLALTTLNKNFNKIINDIKSQKSDKFTKLKEDVESIDFTDLTSRT